MNCWSSVKVKNDRGCENGWVLSDEEYAGKCRVTVEKCKGFDAITCGIYGLFFHTIYTSFEGAIIEGNAIKQCLKEFIDGNPDSSKMRAFPAWFMDKFPF